MKQIIAIEPAPGIGLLKMYRAATSVQSNSTLIASSAEGMSSSMNRAVAVTLRRSRLCGGGSVGTSSSWFR